MSSSIKTCLKHSFTHDRLDDSLTPTRGYMFSMTSELALPPGDVSFMKHVLTGKAYARLPVFSGTSLGLSVRVGSVYSLLSGGRVYLPDRFFLGGPLHVRGWESRRVGPVVDGDSVGGSCVFAGGVHLTRELYRGVRGHLFGNVGDLVSSPRELLSSTTSRASVGAGLVVSLMQARLEVNLVHPVLGGGGRVKRLHWGIGIDFV